VLDFGESLLQRSVTTHVAMPLVTILIATIVSVGAEAETAPVADKKTKRTTINFEDQLIEGRATKPELFVLLQNRMNNSRRLFKLRENFLPEMRKTAEDSSRAGGDK
jgi:hypothetical protein